MLHPGAWVGLQPWGHRGPWFYSLELLGGFCAWLKERAQIKRKLNKYPQRLVAGDCLCGLLPSAFSPAHLQVGERGFISLFPLLCLVLLPDEFLNNI